jgi:hypothetical protein
MGGTQIPPRRVAMARLWLSIGHSQCAGHGVARRVGILPVERPGQVLSPARC